MKITKIMNQKIENLRNIIKSEGLNGYIITTSDEFLSEYPAPYAKRLEYITDFSCSNGFLIILEDNVLFFTDARYKTSAENSLKYAQIFNIFEMKTFDFGKYIKTDQKIGYDPKLFTKNSIKLFEKLNIVQVNDNLVDKIWDDRPPLPSSNSWHYDIKYTGKNAEIKIAEVREWLNAKSYEAALLTAPESVCWLLNIRASDSDFSPIMLGILYLDFENIILFTNSRKFDKGTIPKNVEIKNFDQLNSFLKNSKKRISITTEANLAITNSITNPQIDEDPTLLARAIKNEAEILGAQNVHIRDAVALCEFLAWFKGNKNDLSEYEAGLKLSEFRNAQVGYLMDSFPPICGFAENGAKIHYKASKEKSKVITGDGLLLIDSGGHYYGGTTDITRTLVMGKATNEQRKYYTKVLRGHIALAKIKFPKGIKGANLDILARQYLWNDLEDYPHGTGHGVGNALFVHEGPMRISLYDSKITLEEWMVISNEPGYYKEGSFGIRIENLQYIRSCTKNTKFLEFQQLSLVPYCADLIIFEDLAKDEIEYLKSYYKKIEQIIVPLLSKQAKDYALQEIYTRIPN